MATITGTSGNDLLNGTWSDDTLDGGDAQSGAIGNNRADYSNNTSAQPINDNLALVRTWPRTAWAAPICSPVERKQDSFCLEITLANTF